MTSPDPKRRLQRAAAMGARGQASTIVLRNLLAIRRFTDALLAEAGTEMSAAPLAFDAVNLNAIEVLARESRQALARITDIHRASGDAVCDVCGEEYRKHPPDDSSFEGSLYLHMACDGRRLKL
jgi:hypothetical protein